MLPEPYILEEVAVVPGVDGRKMSKSYGNTIAMFGPEKQLKKAVMGIVTDSTPVEAPKDPTSPSSSSGRCSRARREREEMFARAKAGGLGYGEVKKDLLARLLDYFAPMRERREALARAPTRSRTCSPTARSARAPSWRRSWPRRETRPA